MQHHKVDKLSFNFTTAPVRFTPKSILLLEESEDQKKQANCLGRSYSRVKILIYVCIRWSLDAGQFLKTSLNECHSCDSEGSERAHKKIKPLPLSSRRAQITTLWHWNHPPGWGPRIAKMQIPRHNSNYKCVCPELQGL